MNVIFVIKHKRIWCKDNYSQFSYRHFFTISAKVEGREDTILADQLKVITLSSIRKKNKNEDIK